MEGAGFCSLYQEIHYNEIHYNKIWVYIYVPMLYVVDLTERVFLKQFHQISKKNER